MSVVLLLRKGASDTLKEADEGQEKGRRKRRPRPSPPPIEEPAGLEIAEVLVGEGSGPPPTFDWTLWLAIAIVLLLTTHQLSRYLLTADG